jgi:hypothetical protein
MENHRATAIGQTVSIPKIPPRNVFGVTFESILATGRTSNSVNKTAPKAHRKQSLNVSDNPGTA